jgi:hypothetical protein
VNDYLAAGLALLLVPIALVAFVVSVRRQRARSLARRGTVLDPATPAPHGYDALHAQGIPDEPWLRPAQVTPGVWDHLRPPDAPAHRSPLVSGLWAACPNPTCGFDRTQVLRRNCPECATELVPTGRSPRVGEGVVEHTLDRKLGAQGLRRDPSDPQWRPLWEGQWTRPEGPEDVGRHRSYREDDTDTTAMTLHDLRPIERRVGEV